MQKMTSIGALAGLLATRKAGEDYAYLGKGAILGEKDLIVFWHRDKAKGTYRAVYGDLTPRDVLADVIPRP